MLGRRQSHHQSGFSLLELLVTISIIAVLLGITLPVLPRVRDSARRTACAANYHGIAQAFQIYKDEHEQKFPAARYMPPPWLSGDEDPPLRVALEGYIDSMEAWRCPGDPLVFDMPYVDENGHDQICGMSYDYETGISGVTHDQSFFAQFIRQEPSDTPISNDFDNGGYETQEGEIVQIDYFHEKRNVLFADGHIE